MMAIFFLGTVKFLWKNIRYCPKWKQGANMSLRFRFFSLRSPDHFLSFLVILEYFGIFSFWS
jgi:hypothetical protein